MKNKFNFWFLLIAMSFATVVCKGQTTDFTSGLSTQIGWSATNIGHEPNYIESSTLLEPYKMDGHYPKAYDMLSLFEGLVEYYRVTDEINTSITE